MESAAKSYASILSPDKQSLPNGSTAQIAMLNATPDCIKVLTCDGLVLTMNRAGCLALEVPEDSAFGMAWLPLLAPEVHAAGEHALREAAAGSSARFSGQSFAPGGIRHWDNLLTPILDEHGLVVSILCVSRDVTEMELLKEELENAVAREHILAQEMRHRIKNLFAVVSSLIHFSEKEAEKSEGAVAATSLLRDKMSALSRASDAAFTKRPGDYLGDREVHVGGVIASVLSPYGERCSINEGAGVIDHDLVSSVTLILHELACNSLKYGALGSMDGNVDVSHAVADGSLNLSWVEAGGPGIAAPPEAVGYGSLMVDRLVGLAGGRVTKDWQPQGLQLALSLPLHR